MISLRAAVLRTLLKLPLSRSLRLDVQESLINLLYDKDETDAGKAGGDLGRIEGGRIFELGHLEEEREVLLTNELVSVARQLRVPVQRPQFTAVDNRMTISGDWQLGDLTREVFLTEEGYQKLRTAIREERKARREARAHTINWITAWTGLLGAAAAIIGAYAAILALQSKP